MSQEANAVEVMLLLDQQVQERARSQIGTHQGASLFTQRDPTAHLGGSLGVNQCQVELAHGKRFRLLPETCLS